MITISQKHRKEISENPFFKTCVQKKREGHVCSGNLQAEHAYSRQNGMRDVVVMVCSSCNYSPDKDTKKFSQLMAIEHYGIEYLQKCNWKKDWKKEFELLKNYFK